MTSLSNLNIDPSRIPDSAWELESVAPDGSFRTYIHWIDRETGTFIRKKVNLIEPELLELNKHQLQDSETKRFGDGKSVGRIPLNIFYRDIAPRLSDEDHLKWWLNQEKNRPYRNFRGKI